MDSAYLQTAVGPALTDALAKVGIARPEDPIDYIAQYLYKYNKNLAADKKEADEGAAIKSVLDAIAEQQRKATQLAEEAARIAAEEVAKAQAAAVVPEVVEPAAPAAPVEEAPAASEPVPEAKPADEVPSLIQGDTFTFPSADTKLVLRVGWDQDGAPADLDVGAVVAREGTIVDAVGLAKPASEGGALTHLGLGPAEGARGAGSVAIDLAGLQHTDRVLAFVLATESGAAGALQHVQVGVEDGGKTLFTHDIGNTDGSATALLLLAITYSENAWTARVLGSAAAARSADQLQDVISSMFGA